MNENLNKTRGLYNSQRVLLKLIEKGLTRENAYRIVQNTAMISWEKGKEFFELLKNDKKVVFNIYISSKKNIDVIPKRYLKKVYLIVNLDKKDEFLTKKVFDKYSKFFDFVFLYNNYDK